MCVRSNCTFMHMHVLMIHLVRSSLPGVVSFEFHLLCKQLNYSCACVRLCVCVTVRARVPIVRERERGARAKK